MTEREAQAALAEIALELAAIEDRLHHIHDALPESPNREAMWEHKAPRDVPTEIVGAIECVVADQLRPMIEQLEAAARVTPKSCASGIGATGAAEAAPRTIGGMAMTTMPEPHGPEDERFVYVVTETGLVAVREGAVAVDSETAQASELADQRPQDSPLSLSHD